MFVFWAVNKYKCILFSCKHDWIYFVTFIATFLFGGGGSDIHGKRKFMKLL